MPLFILGLLLLIGLLIYSVIRYILSASAIRMPFLTRKKAAVIYSPMMIQIPVTMIILWSGYSEMKDARASAAHTEKRLKKNSEREKTARM